MLQHGRSYRKEGPIFHACFSTAGVPGRKCPAHLHACFSTAGVTGRRGPGAQTQGTCGACQPRSTATVQAWAAGSLIWLGWRLKVSESTSRSPTGSLEKHAGQIALLTTATADKPTQEAAGRAKLRLHNLCWRRQRAWEPGPWHKKCTNPFPPLATSNALSLPCCPWGGAPAEASGGGASLPGQACAGQVGGSARAYKDELMMLRPCQNALIPQVTTPSARRLPAHGVGDDMQVSWHASDEGRTAPSPGQAATRKLLHLRPQRQEQLSHLRPQTRNNNYFMSDCRRAHHALTPQVTTPLAQRLPRNSG